MSLLPSPSSGRGEIVLQPAYFTSSAFVYAARADVDTLVREYVQWYSLSSYQHFALFSEIWRKLGWTWIQFKVFDARSRAAFLRVVMRLFLERVGAGENPLIRAAALFGLYTILRTQPSTSAPSLYTATQVEVTCDVYEEILMLPDALDEEFLLPIRPHVVYVQSDLLQSHVFQILPHATTHPLNPRELPREVVTEDAEAEGRKKRGRPSKREKIKKTKESLIALERWSECGSVENSALSATRSRFASEKATLLEAIGRDERWTAALGEVRERLELII